jgi:hypothetical protein
MNKLILQIFVLAFLLSCTHNPASNDLIKSESNLTPGMITETVEKGKTTKAKILEVFGPPDLITHEDSTDMWGYDKISRSVAYGSFGLGGLGGGLVGGALLGGMVSGKQGYSEQTTKTVFLLLYFRKNILIDYKLSSTKF